MTTAAKKARGNRSRASGRPARTGASTRKRASAARSSGAVNKAAKTAIKKPAKGAAKLPGKATLGAAKSAARNALEPLRDVARRTGEAVGGGARDIADGVREHTSGGLAAHVRRLPIQRSIDIAVPVEVAWDEWMRLESLPEGAHRVEDIERDGDGRLLGRLSGFKVADWEAEVLDEREDESFAWRSVRGSDCAGLVTFHPLSDRLTRLELQLDVVPSRLREAAALALHLADRRAETELRIFKARLETISPDKYPDLADEAEADERDHEEE